MLWNITTEAHGTLVYDPDALSLAETFELKRLAGLTLADLNDGFVTQDPDAWRFIWYVTCQRAGIDLGDYASIEFNWRDMDISPVVQVEAEPVVEEGPTTPPEVAGTTTGETTPSE